MQRWLLFNTMRMDFLLPGLLPDSVARSWAVIFNVFPAAPTHKYPLTLHCVDFKNRFNWLGQSLIITKSLWIIIIGHT